MNKARRKEVTEIATRLEEVQALLGEIREHLEQVMDEEQAALNNMPENLQDSEKGCQMQECIYTMDSVLDDLCNLDLETMRDQLLEFV